MKYYLAMHLRKLQRLSEQKFDVAIIGGGLIGASMARAISGYGLNIVVIDNKPYNYLYQAALDNRGLALSYGSKLFLEKICVWQSLERSAYPIKTVHVSEKGCFGASKLSALSFNLPALGYVVGASALGSALTAELNMLVDVTVLRPVELQSLHYNADTAWTIGLGAYSINSKILIAADGSDSSIRSYLKIPTYIKNYEQSAIVTNLLVQQSHHDTAYERFTEHGVLAILPFGANKMKCVWTVNNDVLYDLMRDSEDEYLNKVQKYFGLRLGKFLGIDTRIVYPIQQIQASCLYAQNAVLLGNAANTLHPVAAQGFNLGLRDVNALAQLIITKNDLAQYSAIREKDHYATQKYTSMLADLFAEKKQLIKICRAFGIVMSQLLPTLNRKIISQGVGVWTS